MKDKEAREHIGHVNFGWFEGGSITGDGLLFEVELLRRKVANLEFPSALSVKDCPKCKHPVLAVFHPEEIETTYYASLSGWWRCLTCGVKFVCSNKQVCEVVKDG